MGIADVLNVAITVSGSGPTQEGFGEPLILAYHTYYTDRVREYSSPSDMLTDGFVSSDLAYLAAVAICNQTPRPPRFKVGRRALPNAQVLHLTCLSTAATDTYTFSVNLPGATIPLSVAAPTSPAPTASTGVPSTDAATIAAKITALSIPHLTVSVSSATIVLTMAAGHLIDVQPDLIHMSFADVTADSGSPTTNIATDLAAVYVADNNWYGLLLDSNSPTEITEAAAWANANNKLFIWNATDTACYSASTGPDIFTGIKALGYSYTPGILSANQVLSYRAAAWMGRNFPSTPGTANWAFKTLQGQVADNLPDGYIHNVEGKNGSVYTTIFGLDLTQFGKTPDGEWIDIVIGKDALTNQLQVQVLALQANNNRIPYTDAGVDMYRSTIGGVLNAFVASGFLAATPAPTVTMPPVASITATQKAARQISGSFTAVMAGAINEATLLGTLTY